MDEVIDMILEDKIILCIAMFQDVQMKSKMTSDYSCERDFSVFQKTVQHIPDQASMLRLVEVLGSIMCREYEEEPGMAELGMLAVSKKFLRKGIASNLISAAETHARVDLSCNTMRLEILSPRDFEHPMKMMLK